MRQGRLQLAVLQVKGGELVLGVEAVRIPERRVREPPLDGGGLCGLWRGGLARLRACTIRSHNGGEHERDEKPKTPATCYQ